MHFLRWFWNRLVTIVLGKQTYGSANSEADVFEKPIVGMKPNEYGYIVRWAVFQVDGQDYINSTFNFVSSPNGTMAVLIMKTADLDCPFVVYRRTAFNHGNYTRSADGVIWPYKESMVLDSYVKCKILD